MLRRPGGEILGNQNLIHCKLTQINKSQPSRKNSTECACILLSIKEIRHNNIDLPERENCKRKIISLCSVLSSPVLNFL